jgi:hypothetical protein
MTAYADLLAKKRKYLGKAKTISPIALAIGLASWAMM